MLIRCYSFTRPSRVRLYSLDVLPLPLSLIYCSKNDKFQTFQNNFPVHKLQFEYFYCTLPQSEAFWTCEKFVKVLVFYGWLKNQQWFKFWIPRQHPWIFLEPIFCLLGIVPHFVTHNLKVYLCGSKIYAYNADQYYSKEVSSYRTEHYQKI